MLGKGTLTFTSTRDDLSAHWTYRYGMKGRRTPTASNNQAYKAKPEIPALHELAGKVEASPSARLFPGVRYSVLNSSPSLPLS